MGRNDSRLLKKAGEREVSIRGRSKSRTGPKWRQVTKAAPSSALKAGRVRKIDHPLRRFLPGTSNSWGSAFNQAYGRGVAAHWLLAACGATCRTPSQAPSR